ncbi:MAG TPA: NifB/NifX family molybdenum-iron cluster-binding protein [Phycisphaerae bacterium]|nr:NifB/NifX family molybdenum-iron cluster-binding protein [Phycisphaerae bacterium]HUT57353.1 NifB/NifX family molybdenum-iron cluster-binding protein [Phycisphaerae bacterium]
MSLRVRVAIPVWSDRVSPVFDTAGQLMVLEVDGGRELSRSHAALGQVGPDLRPRRLSELGVDVLVCGAISQPLEAMVAAQGVQVVPQVCGPVEQVVEAFLVGQLGRPEFLMPGCCRRRRGFCGGHGRGGGRGGRRGDMT